MLGATPLGKHFKFSVTNGNQVAVVFFSDEIQALLVEASSIQVDGTFDVVPIQFYQLWTIFISVGRHTVPAIHCLMTAKSQVLYSSLLEQLVTRLPEFKPVTSMSDWERAPRNSIAEVFPHIRISDVSSTILNVFGQRLKNSLLSRISKKPLRYRSTQDY